MSIKNKKIIKDLKSCKLVPEVHLFLIENGKILILRRYNTSYEDGKYSVIAGKVEANESIKAAMIRETKEESGIMIKEKDLVVCHVMYRFIKKNHQRVGFFLTAKKWEGKPRNAEPNKCDEMIWRNINNLPKNFLPYVKKAILNFQKNIFFDEFGWQ